MTTPGRSAGGAAYRTAYACHIVLAVIVCLVLAMQIHLWAIDAKGDVVGAGMFLLVVWLGLPAVILAILAIYYSLKASDKPLLWLLIAMAAPFFAFDAPVFVLFVLEAVYVAAVIAVWLLARRQRVTAP